MLFFKQVSLIILWVSLASMPVWALQEQDPDVAWYEQLLQGAGRSGSDESLALATARLQNARNEHDAPGQAKALLALGIIHMVHINAYDSATDYLIQSLALVDSLHLTKEHIFTYLAMARLFEEVGDYAKSAELISQALRLSQTLDNTALRIFILNELGKTNAAMGKIEEAFQNYQQVLDDAGEDNPKARADALFNRAHLYTEQGHYNEALQTHKQALTIRRKLHDKAAEASSLNDIGELYHLMKNDQRAMANHLVALQIREDLEDKRGIAESFNNIGVLYARQGNCERAISNLELALHAARESDDKHAMLKSLDFLCQCYTTLGDLKRALAFKTEQYELNDFILREEMEQQLRENQNRYVIAKKESQIDKLEVDRQQRERELAAQKKLQNFLMAVIALVVIVVLLIAYFYIDKRKSNKQLEVVNKKVSHQNKALEEANKKVKLQNHELEVVNRKVLQQNEALEAANQEVSRQNLALEEANRMVSHQNQELEAVNTTVKDQNQELQDLNATKDKFFSIISHDLKGPLNSLTSFSGLLMNHTDSLSTDEIKMLATDLDKSLKNLFALLENLLEWSRAQTGAIAFTPEDFDLAEVLQENRELLEGQAKNKEITITNEHATALPVYAHKASVKTVVRNLISNAIKFTPNGGTITVKASEGKGEVIVSIADTGVGMPPEVVKKLFRIESKHSTQGTANEKGTGLGLILCKEFVEKNGGMILVESEVDKGSVFHFTLPEKA